MAATQGTHHVIHLISTNMTV